MTQGNLLINPGAELSDLNGWIQVGLASVLQETGGILYPGYNPRSGIACFAGGNGSGGKSSSLLQNVNLIKGLENYTAAQLDAGTLMVEVSFHYQTYYFFLFPYDDTKVTITFRGAYNEELDRQTSGIVTCSFGSSNWCHYRKVFSIPVGTRHVEYTMIFTSNFGTKIGAYIDDASLRVV